MVIEVIRTARLLLVPVRVEHAEEMAGVLADPRLHEFIGGEPEDLPALRARYRRWVAGSPDPDVIWGNWILRYREDGGLVGMVQATIGADATEVAWVVGRPWQGRGFATEAGRGLLDSLRQHGVEEAIACVHPGNFASASVAKALGFVATRRRRGAEVEWRLTLRHDS